MLHPHIRNSTNKFNTVKTALGYSNKACTTLHNVSLREHAVIKEAYTCMKHTEPTFLVMDRSNAGMEAQHSSCTPVQKLDLL